MANFQTSRITCKIVLKLNQQDVDKRKNDAENGSKDAIKTDVEDLACRIHWNWIHGPYGSV